MPKAINDITTSTRRATMRSSIAALTAGLTSSALASAAHGTDEVLAAAKVAIQCDERLTEINTHGDTDEACRAALTAWDAAFLRLAELPATTLVGLQAKAAALSRALRRECMDEADFGSGHGFEPSDLMHDNCRDTYLAWSLCSDLAAIGGAA